MEATVRQANVGVTGFREHTVSRGNRPPRKPESPWITVLGALPWFGLGRAVNLYRLRNLVNIWRGFYRVALAGIFNIPTHYGVLYARKINKLTGEVIDLGVVSMRVVTDTGVAFIVDAFQNTTEVENLKFHGYGTGAGAEAAGNTALTTELTTQYATDNTRPTGTTTEGATANIYRTVATLDPDADVGITEHGVFSQAATGGGTLLDRSLFTVINLSGAGGDTLQTTYELTFTSGG
jgi:hypothetical protein